jgi:desulfoferrodoxin-like iron-binding protein
VSAPAARGRVYRCEVCGAEVTVLARQMGRFMPRCCTEPMIPEERRVAFYVCPVCKAEIAVLRPAGGAFRPRCCNVAMERDAA